LESGSRVPFRDEVGEDNVISIAMVVKNGNRQGAKGAPVKHPERAPGFTGQAKEER
jgi:hypothetical protein